MMWVTTPTVQMSAGGPTTSPFIISGAWITFVMSMKIEKNERLALKVDQWKLKSDKWTM